MRGSLREWLKFRKRNDEVAAGQRRAKIPAHLAAQRLPAVRDWQLEERLAGDLYTLLSEIMDPRELPNPKAQGAAVWLAEIVVAGKLPEEQQTPTEAGLIWLWPIAIIAGIGGIVIMTKIQSDADVAREKERMECIKSGACTDYGFWLKLGGVAVVGWFVWEKLGVKQKVQRLTA